MAIMNGMNGLFNNTCNNNFINNIMMKCASPSQQGTGKENLWCPE